MGRKGSMNLQVITDNFVKDQSRRRNVQPMSARIPTTPVKSTQRRLSSPDIELKSSPNKKTEEKPNLTINIGPKSAIPKGSAPRSALPLSAAPKSAVPGLRISTLVTSNNKGSGPKTPKTPLSATIKKNPGLSLQPPTSAIPDIDAPDTPVNVIYANAFFDNKEREDEETEAINKKVLKQQRKENIRNMRRERMKQPKDVRVALILGRLYDASHYELGPLSHWSDPEIENNEELNPKKNENEKKENEIKPKKMISLIEAEEEAEKETKERNKNYINHDKTNNVNAHPSWVPEDAGCSDIVFQRNTASINGNIVKRGKKKYIAIASIYAKLYDPILMKKREEEEKLKMIEKHRQNSIITELKPMGRSINPRYQNNSRQNNNGFNNNRGNHNEYYNKNQRYQNYQNRQGYNKGNNYSYINNKYINEGNTNEVYQVNYKENRSQQHSNTRGNFFNKRNDYIAQNTDQNNYRLNNDYNQTYGYGYVYQYPVYPYYDNMNYNNYGQNYNTDGNNYYYSSYGNNNNQNKYKPRMNYQKQNNNYNSYNRTGNVGNFNKYENKVNIKSWVFKFKIWNIFIIYIKY